MRFAGYTMGLVLFWLGGQGARAESPEWPDLQCNSLVQCVGFVTEKFSCAADCSQIELDGSYIPAQEGYFSLPAAFQNFGRQGAETLLRLLNDGDATVRARAGMILSGSGILKREDVPEIVAAWKRGNTWIGGAMVRLANEEIIATLASDIAVPEAYPSSPAVHYLSEIGDRAFAGVTRWMNCPHGPNCTAETVKGFGAYLQEENREYKNGLQILAGIAIDVSLREDVRFEAISAISRQSQPAKDIASTLAPLLSDREQRISSLAVRVLSRTGDPGALRRAMVELGRAKGWNKASRIKWIADFVPATKGLLQEIGQEVGSEDWDSKAALAKAHITLGDKKSVIKLKSQISDSDWFLAFNSVLALGSHRSAEADRILRNVADNYWMPTVRHFAASILETHPEGQNLSSAARFSLNFPLLKYCRAITRDYENLDRSTDKLLRAAFIGSKFGEANVDWSKFQALPVFNGAVEPLRTIVVGDTKFVGTNYGEFGGSLKAFAGKQEELVFDGNVIGVFTVRGMVYAVTGLSHMLIDEGFLWKLERIGNGKWQARKIFRFQGAPRVLLARDGTIGAWSRSGAILINQNGKPKWLGCGLN